jgi:hypothetical protein
LTTISLTAGCITGRSMKSTILGLTFGADHPAKTIPEQFFHPNVREKTGTSWRFPMFV